MVTDFSTKEKASGVQFCRAIHRRPGQGISHFGGTLLHPEAQNWIYVGVQFVWGVARALVHRAGYM